MEYHNKFVVNTKYTDKGVQRTITEYEQAKQAPLKSYTGPGNAAGSSETFGCKRKASSGPAVTSERLEISHSRTLPTDYSVYDQSKRMKVSTTPSQWTTKYSESAFYPKVNGEGSNVQSGGYAPDKSTIRTWLGDLNGDRRDSDSDESEIVASQNADWSDHDDDAYGVSEPEDEDSYGDTCDDYDDGDCYNDDRDDYDDDDDDSD